ncbi:hypothetical protein PPACK8108_LOCUS19606 [Phakopsora pachyrhizi]|uniref:Uncharacterized protein n=1 Tax=Phakopsora pachyrhizi TaxID=170000 RepID=A0AAV0BFF3_PHAPC|nr:hypothetical protein PPACK8108_LOCUS19606 [Phakopsora pachyrhizi]
MELKMRNLLKEVYFSETGDIWKRVGVEREFVRPLKSLTTHILKLDIAYRPDSNFDEVDNNADDEGDSTDDCSEGEKRLENANRYGRRSIRLCC